MHVIADAVYAMVFWRMRYMLWETGVMFMWTSMSPCGCPSGEILKFSRAFMKTSRGILGLLCKTLPLLDNRSLKTCSRHVLHVIKTCAKTCSCCVKHLNVIWQLFWKICSCSRSHRRKHEHLTSNAGNEYNHHHIVDPGYIPVSRIGSSRRRHHNHVDAA
jgi:hypothetical protein